MRPTGPAGTSSGSFDRLLDGRDQGAVVPAWVAWGSVILCLAGLGVDTYLTIQHYLSGVVPLVCTDRGLINCAKVLSSRWSKLLGIPLTDLGVAYFVGMLALCGPWAWSRREPWIRWARLAGVLTSMALVVYLVHAEVADIRAICLFCTLTHAVAFLLFVVVLTGDAYRASSSGPLGSDS